ncbi:GNAT family N-acetyltransferase [Shewanella cyperi]|uniref:GNAT family N-acetyltransferase n=1 Tax=Shewanella cyperi TaxID=2814292 RepID=A0A974XMQ4_9GAMM|nr:GNAT family N-acetyltransferase [Shewanella cyperi]QSX31265.1 GNAT family N-acetyltransferase [Shewanella cyperi]
MGEDKVEVELYTDRLRLRNLRETDKPDFIRLHLDESVNRLVRDIEPLAVIEEKFNQRHLPWYYESGLWLTLVIETLDGRFVGYTGFHCEDGVSKRAEVGYLLAPEAQGQGFATEATRAVIDWGRHVYGIHKFIAWCAADNLGSRRVLEKCGFQLEGLLKQHTLIGGQWHDDCIYGLLA